MVELDSELIKNQQIMERREFVEMSLKYYERPEDQTLLYCVAFCGQKIDFTPANIDKHAAHCPKIRVKCDCCPYVYPNYILTCPQFQCK